MTYGTSFQVLISLDVCKNSKVIYFLKYNVSTKISLEENDFDSF